MGVSLLSVESKKAPDLRTSLEQRGKLNFPPSCSFIVPHSGRKVNTLFFARVRFPPIAIGGTGRGLRFPPIPFHKRGCEEWHNLGFIVLLFLFGAWSKRANFDQATKHPRGDAEAQRGLCPEAKRPRSPRAGNNGY